MAFSKLQDISESQKIREEMSARQRDIMTWQTDFNSARSGGLEEGMEKGVKKGRAEGLEEGMERGIKKGRLEGREEGREEGRAEGVEGVAMGMLKNGIDLKTIKKCTGLAEQAIEALKNKG